MAMDAHRGHGGGAEPPVERPASASLDDADLMFTQRGCCCFWIPNFGSGGASGAVARRGGSWERIGDGAPSAAPELSPSPGRPWWRSAILKVREWSEIVAGPQWKTFIRRFNRHRHHRPHHHRRTSSGVSLCGGGGAGGLRAGQFHYDPLSYALNFDEGPGGQGGGDADDDLVYRNFSARYVMPPSSAKSSMDLGGRDAPPLFHAA